MAAFVVIDNAVLAVNVPELAASVCRFSPVKIARFKTPIFDLFLKTILASNRPNKTRSENSHVPNRAFRSLKTLRRLLVPDAVPEKARNEARNCQLHAHDSDDGRRCA